MSLHSLPSATGSWVRSDDSSGANSGTLSFGTFIRVIPFYNRGLLVLTPMPLCCPPGDAQAP